MKVQTKRNIQMVVKIKIQQIEADIANMQGQMNRVDQEEIQDPQDTLNVKLHWWIVKLPVIYYSLIQWMLRDFTGLEY